ncbi:hypothetical protein PENSPDRAFT_694928 [Peniophora sp. CONT]|nr:hypothetical protein PENSPDRAFT_694928 [Peniophora sp. CONT]
MPTLHELIHSSRDAREAPQHSADEIRALVEPDAQRMLGYLQAQTTSTVMLAEDPGKRDRMLRDLRQQNPNAPNFAGFVRDDQDPYDVLEQCDAALSVPAHTFEEHFARWNHATIASMIFFEIKGYELQHDAPLRDAFQSRWLRLHDQWLKELSGHPQPEPQAPVENNPAPPSARPPLPAHAKLMTDNEVAALMLDPEQLSSKTFCNLPGSEDGGYKVPLPRRYAYTDRLSTYVLTYASSAKQHAYDAHSHFRVGASVLSTQGAIITGSSVDNAAYGASLCAERTALAKAVIGDTQSDGLRAFVALAITSDVDAPLPPCGSCRQVIREFCPPEAPILLVPASYRPGLSGDGITIMRVKDLLPLALGPELAVAGIAR